MPRITIELEQETDQGWEYTVLVGPAQPPTLGSDSARTPPRATPAASMIGPTRHTVTLAYIDHDYWSGGKVAPSQLLVGLLEFVLDRRSGTLPARFDAARARWWFPAIDAHLRGAKE